MGITNRMRHLRTIITGHFILGLVLIMGCEEFPQGSEVFQQKFVYQDNYYSWANDLVQLKNKEGFLLITDEGYEPFGSSIIKLDNEFNVVWKNTFEFTYFRQIHELSNGEILLAADRVIYKMKSDGSEFSQVESLLGYELKILGSNNDKLLIYGFDNNYKAFIARYNSSLQKEAELNLNVHILTINSAGEIFTISRDGVQKYSFERGLIEDFEAKLEDDFWITDFQLDKDGNFLVLGTTTFGECCCDDKIALVKFAPDGKRLWGRKLGSSKANNYSISLLIEDDRYLICGLYGEDSCINKEGFDGNWYNAYAAKISLNGNPLGGYVFGRASDSDGISKIIKVNSGYYAPGGFTFSGNEPRAVIYQLKHF